jgi:peptidoglycan hydrolase-like protein with peptidoglycan-binding domain
LFGRNNASGSQIRAAQEALKEQGYYGGEIDGIAGPITRSAAREYQGDHELEVTGRLDRATLDSLGVE